MTESMSEPVPDTSGPRGLGGWLILPAISLVLSPAILVVALVVLLDEIGPDILEALTPGHPFFALLAFELGANIALAIFCIVVAVFFFRKKRATPTLYILLCAAVIGVVLIDSVMADAVVRSYFPDEPFLDRQGIVAIVTSGIWIAYFSWSVRVRNTFVE